MANAKNRKVIEETNLYNLTSGNHVGVGIGYKHIIKDCQVLSCPKAAYAHNGTALYECAKIINEYSLDFIQLKGDLVLTVLPENLWCDLFVFVGICTLDAKIEAGLRLEINHSKGSAYAYSLEVSRVIELEGYSYLELKSMGSGITVAECEKRRHADRLASGFKIDAEYEKRRRAQLDLLDK